MLYGIDIASYQESLVPKKMTTTDFIIVKATGGNSYTNPCYKSHADATLKAGKLLGFYHFACEYGHTLTAQQEADYFLKAVKPYVGKATLWLDFEMDALDYYTVAWCKEWLDTVKKATGCTPGIYMSKSVANSRDWSIVKDYPLWVAQYPNYEPMGYTSKPWTDYSGYGAWKSPTIFQYTSSGDIAGYDGRLDLNLFYGSKSDWEKLAGAKSTAQTTEKKAEKPKWQKMVELAIEIADDDSHGYSQYRRWPSQGKDFDCSSLMYYCADQAGYGVDMNDPRWTGSMDEDFTNAGFKKMNYNRSKLVAGDILLSHNDSVQHTELYVGDGKTAGAHIAETGGINGVEGDQTGNEISVQNLSWTPQWILRPPDSGATASESQPAAQQPTTSTTTSKTPVKYRSSTDKSGKKWLSTYSNIERDGYSGQIGAPMRWLAIDGVKRYRVCTEDSGWLPWVTKFDVKDLDNGCAGDGSPITGVQVDDATCCYAVHVMNLKKWYADMKGLVDSGGSGDNFAGDLGNRIDAIRCKRI